MQHLLPVPVRRLRIAAARLRTERRRSGTDRAIWIAARNYRRDGIAQPDDTPETVKLPHCIANRIGELTPEETEENKDGSS